MTVGGLYRIVMVNCKAYRSHTFMLNFFYDNTATKTVPRQHKPLPKPKSQPNPDFRINPDSDPAVCRIDPKMSASVSLPSVVKIGR